MNDIPRPPLRTELAGAMRPKYKRWKDIRRLAITIGLDVDVYKTIIERARRKGITTSGEVSFLIGVALKSGQDILPVGGWYRQQRVYFNATVPSDYLDIVRWVAARIVPDRPRADGTLYHALAAVILHGLQLVTDDPEIDFVLTEIESGARREMIGASYNAMVRRLNREMNELVDFVDREMGDAE